MDERSSTTTYTSRPTPSRARLLLRQVTVTAIGAALAIAAVSCSSRDATLAPDGQDHETVTASGGAPKLPVGRPPGAGATAILPPERAIDLDAAGVFGVRPGPADPDAVRTSVSEVLGPPTRDTGWYHIPIAVLPDGTQDCTGGMTQRVLRWGDLALAFWDSGSTGTDEVLWSWTLGDPAASAWGDRHEPSLPAITPVGVSTPDGVQVGTPVDALLGLYGARLTLTDPAGNAAGPSAATLGILAPSPATTTITDAAPSIGFAFRDGIVTGIGGTLSFC